jgi:hypothetical protein
LVSEAQKNAEIYPVVYLFENSVRSVVSAILANAYGRDWWDLIVDPKIKRSVDIRQKAEQAHPWHSKRGQKPIHYTDIEDLKKIISMQHKVFRGVMGPSALKHAELWIEEIERTRNVLAHNNPVSASDRKRLESYSKDWHALAKSMSGKLP